MIWGIITTFLDSISTVFYKNAANVKMNNHLFQFLWNIGAFFIIFYFYVSGKIDLVSISFLLFLLIPLGIVIDFVYSKMEQFIYSTEKVSVIAPYDQLNKVFTIILGFIIFWDTSIISFAIALLLVWVLTLANINYAKKIVVPKNIKIIVIYNFLISAQLLVSWYILVSITEETYFSVHVFLLTALILIMLLRSKNIKKEIKKVDRTFMKNQFLYSFLWYLSFLITLIIIKEEGIVTATLLWFLWFISTMVFSWLFLKEKVDKWNILLWTIILIWVSIWFYFKDF